MNKKELMCNIYGYPFTENAEVYLPLDDKLHEVLNTLLPIERFVIENRFSDEGMTFTAIGGICPRKIPTSDGCMMGISGERARQIGLKALRKLRHPERSQLLWPPSERSRGIK